MKTTAITVQNETPRDQATRGRRTMTVGKTYRFGSTTFQGGYLYAHRTVDEEVIKDGEALRTALSALAGKMELIDVTIKIYDAIFFLFFVAKPSLRPSDIIGQIQACIPAFGTWAADYIYTGVDGVQEQFMRIHLKNFGFRYEDG